jgi:peptidoglycan/LPS O-acetylase OafA/YrhL
LTPLWSVGIEEIYYVAWAPLVKWLREHLLTLLLGTVVLKTLVAVWIHSVFHNASAAELLRMLQFEAMAIGGLAALFLFNRRQPLDAHLLFAKPMQLLLIALLLVRLLCHNAATECCPPYANIFGHAVLTPLLHMALFAWLILNAAANERSVIRFHSHALHYLGDISYGVYMYHALPISLLVVPLLKTLRTAPFLPATLLLHLSVASVTLLFAAASKSFFEDKFLRFKNFFQVTSPEQRIIDLSRQVPVRSARVAAA